MAKPENQTLRLLREIREQGEANRGETEKLRSEMREGFGTISDRLKNLQQAMIGESILGPYTVAEVEERLNDLEQRVATLEKQR